MLESTLVPVSCFRPWTSWGKRLSIFVSLCVADVQWIVPSILTYILVFPGLSAEPSLLPQFQTQSSDKYLSSDVPQGLKAHCDLTWTHFLPYPTCFFQSPYLCVWHHLLSSCLIQRTGVILDSIASFANIPPLNPNNLMYYFCFSKIN